MNPDVIGDIYAACSEDESWAAVGQRIFRSFGAHSGTLRVSNGRGSFNLFIPSAKPEENYENYYVGVDPVRAALTRWLAQHQSGLFVATSDELVDPAAYAQSEFYHDFARPNGQEHMLVGAVRDGENTVIGLFRDGPTFGAREKSLLAELLPHLNRALHLRRRFKQAADTARFGHSMLEALPGGAVVVDTDMRVHFANSQVERLCRSPGAPLTLSCSPNSGTLRLSLKHHEKANELRRLVKRSAMGLGEGALRLDADLGGKRMSQFAFLVSPSLHQRDDEEMPETRKPVLILINELTMPSAPRPSLLSDLFGLSPTENAVAIALLGGQSAEVVAKRRQVSLETIRSQIRTIIRKSEANNLRDFERMGAILSAVGR